MEYQKITKLQTVYKKIIQKQLQMEKIKEHLKKHIYISKRKTNNC